MVEANPAQTLFDLALGYVPARCVQVVADLGVADALDETPCTAAALAAAVGADADALGRVLRLLAGQGVFGVEGDAFRHTPASRLLRADHPYSLRAPVGMIGRPPNWSSFEALEHTVRTGLPATERLFPGGFWGYYGAHPEEGARFNAAMAGKAQVQIAALLAAYDFSEFSVIGDIGGGSGHVLRAVLDAAPAARGVLFDLPPVVANAASLASARLTIQGGDFFRDALPACDAYLVMEVLHDWDDAQAVAILQAIRRAAPPQATLLLIEQVLADAPGPHRSKTMDVLMLTLLGGRQRTQQEFAALLERAGFAFQRQIDTAAETAILEAVPA